MGDWGIKITRETKGVTSTDLRDLLMHSNFTMFKYHSDTPHTMTINAGDTTKTITIPHNLGYVPAFLAYIGDENGIGTLPARRSYYFVGMDEHIFATADSTNIYITWKSTPPYNQQTYYVNDYYNAATGTFFTVRIGTDNNGLGRDCAMRFVSMDINSGNEISSATLNFYVSATGGGNSNVKFKTYGIDEDDFGNFFDNYPMGANKTTAETVQEQVMSGTPFSCGINVTNQVKEIADRAGWSNLNAMSFIFNNNSSSNDCTLFDDTMGATLTIQKSGTFTYDFRVLVFKDKIHN